MPEPKGPFKTAFSTILQREMDTQGISITEFADAVGVSYEYARKMLNKDSIPAYPLLRMIATFLGLEYEEIAAVVARDQIRKKFGDLPLTELGVNPDVSSINDTWEFLTDEQRTAILSQVKGYLVENRKAAKPPEKGYTKPVAKKKPNKKG